MQLLHCSEDALGIPGRECQYSSVGNSILLEVVPAIAGPKRPQDRIELDNVKRFAGNAADNSGMETRNRSRKV